MWEYFLGRRIEGVIIFMIDSRFYYYLINKAANKALSFKWNKDPSKQSGTLNEINEQSMEEVWMFKKTHFQGVYYLMHCYTGLVLQKNRKKLDLHHQHEKYSQYFIIHQNNTDVGCVWIEEYTEPTNLLSFEKTLECKKTENTNLNAVWKLKRVTDNEIINHSCILSCQYSGLVMNVGLNNEKEGRSIEKASWTGIFNQRWEVKKINNFYTIRNLKTKLIVSLNEKKIKEGNNVILAIENNNFHYQLWCLEERGFNEYSIKTAYHQQLYIGIKDHNLSQGCGLILVKNQSKNVWKMIGTIIT